MMLFRGLKEPYQPEVVRALGPLSQTDFTDCPFTALGFAVGAQGEVLVLDASKGNVRVSEAEWPAKVAKRFIVWGPFEASIVFCFPARIFRARVRTKGIVAAPEAVKRAVLERLVEDCLAGLKRTLGF